MRKGRLLRLGAGMAVVLLAAACGSSGSSKGSGAGTSTGGGGLTASAPGVTPTTITIGYITSQTGVASSTFADGPGGAQARVALQNARGGVDGRRIVLVPVDDQSSPAQDQTAAQDLIQQHNVFGIVDFSPFTFGGTTYLSQQGVPVTGFGFDGPEWAAPTSTNMFSWSPLVDTPIQGKEYGYTTNAQVLKAVGVTKLGGLGYGISASSQASIRAILTAAESLGIKKCYENQSVPFGGVDFTAAVLAIKGAGCDGVVGSFVDSSDLALSGAIKHAGLNVKQMYFTGYDSQIESSATNRAAFEGAYVAVSYDPNATDTASKTMFDALKKYDSAYTGGIPDLGLYGSYISTDEMIYGLEQAGKNPTRQSFIANMHKVTGYNAGGLLSTPIGFTNFGTPQMLPQTQCGKYAYIQGTKFVYYNGGQLVCGKLIEINPNV